MFYKFSRSALSGILVAVTLAFCLAAVTVWAAEETLTLLTIEGNLIGKIDSLANEQDANSVISAYYEQLSPSVLAEIEVLRRQLAKLVPDYDVAFTAADSAEITEVKSDINVSWSAIRTIHAHEFTQEVVDILDGAYKNVYHLIGQED